MSIQPGTPLPWGAHQGVCEDQPTVWDVTSVSGNWTPCDLTPMGYFVATVHETQNAETAQKDAAYIVHACNTFPELVEAAQAVFDGLNARIDAACASGGQSVPVFAGIAALSDALTKARGQA